jgi:dienelactone hydrolase
LLFRICCASLCQICSNCIPCCPVTAASANPAATILIATDVFGITPAVQSLVRQLSVNALIVSPFQDTERQFRSEQDAYQAFIAEGGVARYTEKLDTILQQQTGLTHAIGFSAGASALWISSQHEFVRSLQNMVLFYGSRIRDYREVLPVCPVRLIFAEQEAALIPRDWSTICANAVIRQNSPKEPGMVS